MKINKLCIVIIIASLIYINMFKYKKETEVVILTKTVTDTLYMSETLTKENVYNYIQTCGIKNPNVAYRQMIFESAHLTSKICIDSFTITGMLNPTVRPNLSITKKGGKWAKFASWQACIEDYKLYQSSVYPDTMLTDNEYWQLLQNIGYFGDSSYMDICDSIHCGYPVFAKKIKLPYGK